MIAVGEYINELDAKMAQTEKHIELCIHDLKSKKHDNDLLKRIKDNLNNSLKRKKILHDEIVGMIDYEDVHGRDIKVDSFGFERFIPTHMKGVGCYVDNTAPSLAQQYGLDDKDFVFW